jgi:hypothetical protein
MSPFFSGYCEGVAMRPEYYTPIEVARIAQVTERTVRRWTEGGLIPGVLYKGGRWYIPASYMLPLLPPDHPDRCDSGR